MRMWLSLVLLCVLVGCGYEPTWQEELVNQWYTEQRSGGSMLLGDSQTMGWPAEMLPDHVFNRGINGDTTVDVIDRFWLVLEEKPDKVFILIGINNYFKGMEDAIVPNVEQMIVVLEENLPDTEIYILRLLPSTWFSNDMLWVKGDEVAEMVSTHTGVTFIDTWPAFMHDGEVVGLFDGLHPGVDGYANLKEILSAYW